MTDVRDPVLPLFISVEPNPEESLMSVLVRASEANVLGRLDRFKSIAGIRNSKVEYVPFAGFQHAEVIAGLLGVSEETILSRMHPAHESQTGEYVDWYGTRLPRRWIETRVMRFSPGGLASGDHHEAIWSIKALEYCPTTLEFLLSVCSHCGREATWTTAKSTVRCAACGNPFADCPTERVSADHRDDARHVAGLVSPDSNVRAQALQSLPSPFHSWEPGDVFHAAVELGFIAGNPAPVEGGDGWAQIARGCFDDYDANDIIAGYRFIRNWPSSLQAHVTDLTAGRSGKTSTLMGSMAKFFVPQASATPLRDLLRVEVPALLRSANVPIRGNQVGGKSRPRPAGTATATEVANIFKIDKKVVARLSTSSSCCIAKSKARSGVVLYNQTSVETALKLWRGGMTLDQAARTLGVPEYSIDALVAAGLLREIADQDAVLLAEGVRLICRASLDELAERLEEQLVVRGETLDAIPLPQAMVGIFHPSSWARAFLKILEGDLRLAGLRERTTPILGRFLVSDQAFDVLRTDDEAKPLPEASVSGMAAAGMLGVTNSLMSGAMKLGIVRGVKTSRRLEVPVSELRRFRREVICGDQVFRKTGITPKEFTLAMLSNGYAPLGKAYRTYFWRRSDAEKLFPSQLG